MDTEAKIEILNYIMQFCISKKFGNGPTVGGLSDCFFSPSDKPSVGDLVALTSAPNTVWYLSWYVQLQSRENQYCDIHTLKSIETGELCDWSNVSFYVLNRELIDKNPHWSWTDKQFQFKDKWFRACYRNRGAYHTLPKMPDFKEDGSVVLGTRKRFGFGEDTNKVFDNWKKLLVRDMLVFYDASCVDK